MVLDAVFCEVGEGEPSVLVEDYAVEHAVVFLDESFDASRVCDCGSIRCGDEEYFVAVFDEGGCVVAEFGGSVDDDVVCVQVEVGDMFVEVVWFDVVKV